MSRSINESVQLLSQTLDNCKTNLAEKQVADVDNIKISDVDEKIAEIQAGGKGGCAFIDGQKFIDCWSSHISDLDRYYPTNEVFKKITFCYDKGPKDTEIIDISKYEDESIVMWYQKDTKEFFVSTQVDGVTIIIPNNQLSNSDSDEYYEVPAYPIFSIPHNDDPGYSYDEWYFDEIDFSGCKWDWSSKTDFRGTFGGASGSIVGINEMLSKVDFSKIIIADHMFESTDEEFVLDKIPNMECCTSACNMFAYSHIKNVSIGSMERLLNANEMFYLSYVETIKIENLQKCKEFEDFISGSRKLTSVSLGNSNGISPTNMSNFLRSYYDGPTIIEVLDLSNFNPASRCDLSQAFRGNEHLTTIYAKNWNVEISNSSIFEGCTSLKGAVSYNSNKTGSDMCNYTTGYFTNPSTKPS